jgi:hypothetical protein
VAPDVRGYTGGWCTAWVASQLDWIPSGLGDAWQWAGNAVVKGLTVTMIPTPDSAVCYGRGGGYSDLGHVAVCKVVFPDGTFDVSEMAYVAWNTTDVRRSTMQDVNGFILAPGVSPGDGVIVAPPTPPAGLDGVRQSWAQLSSWLNHDLPAAIAALAADWS